MLLHNARLTAGLLAVFFIIILGACSAPEAETTNGIVNTSALTNKIKDAEDAKDGVVVSVSGDGSDVGGGAEWVTQKVMDDFEDAIAAANSALLSAKDQATVNKAVGDLNTALRIFNGAKTGGTTPTTDYSATLSWGSALAPLTLGLSPGRNTTELNLNWYSSGAAANKYAKVRFIKGTRAAGTGVIETTGTVTAASAGYTAHKVTVSGLTPGASYQYSISNDDANQYWSPMYDVKIPAAGAFHFAIVTDAQIAIGAVDANSRYIPAPNTCGQGWLDTMTKIVAANPSFIAGMGDNVETTAGNEAEYTSFFTPPGLRNLPYAPTVGNHDRNAAMFKSHFNLPNEQDAGSSDINRIGNYYYLYNNVLFVVLNSSGTGSVMTSVATAQPFITRYDETLKAAKAAHAQYDWLIVQHHKSTASVANHAADPDIQYLVEAGFEKLMSDHNVDFVLAGHDHVYARSYPLSGRDGGKVSVPDKTKGTNVTAANAVYDSEPGNPIYLTFTTASGQGFYPVSADLQFKYNNSLYRDNAVYPYLGESTDGDGSTKYGSTDYKAGNLPVSNARFVQPFIPSYTIVEVNGRTISFKTYPIATLSGTSSGASQAYDFHEDIPYDSVTVTKN